MRTVRTLLFGVLLSFAAGAAAQTVNLPSMTGGPGDTVSATIDFDPGMEDVSSWSIDVMYDRTSLGIVNFPECPVAVGAASPGTIQCSQEAGGQFDVFRVGMFTVPSAAIGAGDVAIVEFTIPLGATPGSSFDLVLDNAVFFDVGGANISAGATVNVGSINVECPTLESCFGSSPAANGSLDLGTAVVGSAATPNDFLSVSNSSTDTTFDVTAFSGPGVLAFADTTGGITVATSGTVDFDNVDQDAVTCTPSARGSNDGSFTLSHDADNGPPSPVSYDFECTGLSPNVEAAPDPVEISGLVPPATAPTGTLTVTNNDPGDGFTSTATGVSVAITSDPDGVFSVSPAGPVSINVNSSQDFAITCANATTTDSIGTATVSYDDPVGGATATIPVSLTCRISDTAPIYNSAPTPGSALTLTAPFGTESAPDGLDINNANTNQAGDDLVISSATASDPVFTVDVINSSFAPNVGADGTDDIEVTCTPAGVGTVNGTLTVQTNDPAQPGGGFTYPLTCQGTGDVISSNPPAGGTLNLGTVPPGTSTGEGLIGFTNNSIDGSVQVDCTVTDAAGVFSVTPPSPFSFTIDPGLTESAAFQCTPTDVSSFTADVSCTTGVPGVRGISPGLNYTVTCAGRPLVIPTMSRWGLLVMSLVLLMVAGVAGRRMLA